MQSDPLCYARTIHDDIGYEEPSDPDDPNEAGNGDQDDMLDEVRQHLGEVIALDTVLSNACSCTHSPAVGYPSSREVFVLVGRDASNGDSL
jgi:hypothetical protein